MSAWESFSTVFNDNTPIYSQIITLFTRSFARGEISAGERIPSIRDMAMLLKVNANTMQRVYQEMERADLISSKRGTGYFFTEDKDMVEKISIGMAGEAIARFLEEMRALGFTDKQIMTELSNCMEGGERNGVAASESR